MYAGMHARKHACIHARVPFRVSRLNVSMVATSITGTRAGVGQAMLTDVLLVCAAQVLRSPGGVPHLRPVAGGLSSPCEIVRSRAYVWHLL